jgi:hypothetical protein
MDEPADRWTLYGARGWGSVLAEAMLTRCCSPYDFVDVNGFDKDGLARTTLIGVNALAQVPTLITHRSKHIAKSFGAYSRRSLLKRHGQASSSRPSASTFAPSRVGVRAGPGSNVSVPRSTQLRRPSTRKAIWQQFGSAIFRTSEAERGIRRCRALAAHEPISSRLPHRPIASPLTFSAGRRWLGRRRLRAASGRGRRGCAPCASAWRDGADAELSRNHRDGG